VAGEGKIKKNPGEPYTFQRGLQKSRKRGVVRGVTPERIVAKTISGSSKKYTWDRTVPATGKI